MLSKPKINLNTISHNSAIDLIQRVLDAKVNLTEIYLDTVGSPEKYREKLMKLFPNIPKIVVASKADATFPIVSAASICAKVTRDSFEERMTVEDTSFSRKYGSGYPGGELSFGSAWLFVCFMILFDAKQ